MNNHKRLKSVETDEYQLEVMECGNCSCHLGIDAPYLDQVGDLQFGCPVCGSPINTREVFPEDKI